MCLIGWTGISYVLMFILKFGSFEYKIEAPLTHVLAPGASIRENTVRWFWNWDCGIIFNFTHMALYPRLQARPGPCGIWAGQPSLPGPSPVWATSEIWPAARSRLSPARTHTNPTWDQAGLAIWDGRTSQQVFGKAIIHIFWLVQCSSV